MEFLLKHRQEILFITLHLIIIVAIIISFYHYKNHKIAAKRHFLKKKFEEILKYLWFLEHEYESLHYIYTLLDKYHKQEEQNAELEVLERFFSKYNEERKKYRKHTDIKNLHREIIHLKLLIDLYVKNKPLKKDLIIYSELFQDLMDFTIQGNQTLKQIKYPHGFPSEKAVKQHLLKIENKLLTFNKLGRKEISENEKNKHRNTVFNK